jgi:Ca-activated chloride channel family protein
MNDISFGEARALWLLVAPAALMLVWAWRARRRRREVRQITVRQVVPGRKRIRSLGELPFWFCLTLGSALLVVAVARPLAPGAAPQRPGLDVVVLQDASASMRVSDVAAVVDSARTAPDRWQRSMVFLRELGDALSWNDDRIAMVTFAHIAAPQIRLTRDPNTLFFFLDHLHARPPFRLEDDTTWDTNLEEAVAWGLRVVDKDAEIHGRSANGAVFVMLSDGESWSGEVARAVARLGDRGVPLYVVGVGSLGGGSLPAVRLANGEVIDSPGVSRLERGALQRIALNGNGQYFELDRDPDREIATTIIAEGRRLAPPAGVRTAAEDLYWWFIAAAGLLVICGLVFVSHRVELGILLGSGIATGAALGALLW